MKNIQCEIQQGKMIDFNNKADYCVGTGRMGLALQKEYVEQLKLVQEKIGFKYIRGHGLFSDDMAIYQEYEDENGSKCAEYNFTYLDLVIDSYLELGIRPFLELGLMPEKIASGKQTVFYWRGNVTPPSDYEKWNEMIKATLLHLMDRYGKEEVVTWPIEVWNEPNLECFWENADMQEYFKLFKHTFDTVKNTCPSFRVGGPAICGVNDEKWIKEFLLFCREEKIALDFITRHHYTSELPEMDGHYAYVKLQKPWAHMETLQSTRDIVDSFEEYKGLEIHITEFNTSYDPKATIHDTNYNAAYVASMLSCMGDMNESYSYWTFGDIFEESGVPFAPFHGGFGMVANGSIPKPTFWTFQFYKQLQGECVHKSKNAVAVHKGDGGYAGVAWNLEEEDISLEFAFPAQTNGRYCLIQKIVDAECCNPLKAWHDMGEPVSLSNRQREILRECAVPQVVSDNIQASDDKALVKVEMKKHAVIYFEIEQAEVKSDRGYSYERTVMQL